MSYRGIFKSGVVVLDPNLHLAEGQAVEVVEIAEQSSTVDALPAAGLWRDRTDIADSGDESLRLRRSIEDRTE
jgi:hypothetical protein